MHLRYLLRLHLFSCYHLNLVFATICWSVVHAVNICPFANCLTISHHVGEYEPHKPLFGWQRYRRWWCKGNEWRTQGKYEYAWKYLQKMCEASRALEVKSGTSHGPLTRLEMGDYSCLILLTFNASAILLAPVAFMLFPPKYSNFNDVLVYSYNAHALNICPFAHCHAISPHVG